MSPPTTPSTPPSSTAPSQPPADDATAGVPDPSSRWAEQGLGKDWQHRFFYWLIRLRGKKRAYHLAAAVTLWYALFHPSVRRRTRPYLDRRFPDRKGAFQRFRDSYRLLRTYSQTLVDMGVQTVMGPTATHITSPDHDAFMDLQKSDRGAVMIQAHAGCWQVGMSTLRHFQVKPISLVLVPEPRTLSQFDPKSISVIDPRTGLEGIMQMTQTLLDGHILVMMGDRTFGSGHNAVQVDFLGGKVWFPVTPYRLASTTGAPVAVAASPKTEEGTYELHLLKVIHVPAGLGRKPDAYQPYAQQFADCLAEFVERHPWQYYNFFDLWADATADAPPG